MDGHALDAWGLAQASTRAGFGPTPRPGSAQESRYERRAANWALAATQTHNSMEGRDLVRVARSTVPQMPPIGGFCRRRASLRARGRVPPSSCASASRPAPICRRLSYLDSCADPGRGVGPNPARVEACASPHASSACPSISQKHSHAFIRVSGHHPRWRNNSPALILQLDSVFTFQVPGAGPFSGSAWPRCPR